MTAHITGMTRHIELSPRVRLAYSRANSVVDTMPAAQRILLTRAVRGDLKACIGADFDNTLVHTDEVKRKFSFLGENPSGMLGALGANAFMGMPVGVISGNTIEYVSARCAEPFQAFMLGFTRKQTSSGKIEHSAVYALNGGYITLYDHTGAENWNLMEAYNSSQRIQEPYFTELFSAMQDAVIPFIKGPVTPIPIRSGLTETHVFAPSLQNRASTQICLIGVPMEERGAIIDAIKSRIDPERINLFSIQPAGEFSIDASLASLKKNSAGKDFMDRTGAEHMFYFGDAVYKRGDSEGNDYSMVHNPNTTVFAVNQNSSEVPRHESVVWIGSGPEATFNMLTWMAVEKANLLINDGEPNVTTTWSLLKYAGMTQEQVTQ